MCLSACATHDPKISIVPYPNHLEPGHGTFAVKGEGVVCDSRADERTQRAVAEFAAQLAKTSGGENPVTVADELPASGIRFVLDQTLPEEGYRLDVTPKGVEVRASRFPGFFYCLLYTSDRGSRRPRWRKHGLASSGCLVLDARPGQGA